jgi:hypothetical protein
VRPLARAESRAPLGQPPLEFLAVHSPNINKIVYIVKNYPKRFRLRLTFSSPSGRLELPNQQRQRVFIYR